MRALGDPDAFPAGDLGVVDAARRLGLASTSGADALRRAVEAVARIRRPAPLGYRLTPINRLPV